eukprot:TRINITY_DN35870_c0_g1_i1.p1 TRINITY_DN35870_c0_g1~~TRINITY_DN35870_c0_g1_i1.p1  ORF type:complete len:114 (-),score=46.89 TRINITY_DN35870_c0_g1_i1:60-401(-)
MNAELVQAPEEEEKVWGEVLKSWLNKNMKVKMSDGRVLVGIFLCTDRAGNVIIGSCNEYTSDPDDPGGEAEEPRILGLAMVPGHHIGRIWVDDTAVRNSSPCNADSDEGLEGL